MSLAVPGYQQFIGRSHRTDAIARMLQVAGCQERLRTVRGGYDTSACLPATVPRYAFEYGANEGNGFTLMALPQAGQADDPCGTLILDHTGSRRVSAPDADVLRCWMGR